MGKKVEKLIRRNAGVLKCSNARTLKESTDIAGRKLQEHGCHALAYVLEAQGWAGMFAKWRYKGGFSAKIAVDACLRSEASGGRANVGASVRAGGSRHAFR